jgi:tRNA (adenine57-N1/adenine58-N1)-methyltransferase
MTMNFTVDRSKADHKSDIMEDGSLVILYQRHDSMEHLYLKAGGRYDCRFGNFLHDDFIGKPFGSKIAARSLPSLKQSVRKDPKKRAQKEAKGGWIYTLRPTPELWSLAVYTRTQIVDESDCAVIAMQLDVAPGCVVCECGTGSGNMTVSLARAVAPDGLVNTFEYNKVRADQALVEFEQLGLNGIIKGHCADVCADGFVGQAPGSVDAVFLDVPEPWRAISYAKDILKPGRGICCYSPCIEQVMKTCQALREDGFHSIRMMEVRRRPFDGRLTELETPDLGLTNTTDQGGANQTSSVSGTSPSSSFPVSIDNTSSSGVSSEEPSRKRSRAEEQGAQEMNSGVDTGNACLQDAQGRQTSDGEGQGSYQPTSETQRAPNIGAPPCALPASKSWVLRPHFTMKGHTAFLTFATRTYDRPCKKTHEQGQKDEDGGNK